MANNEDSISPIPDPTSVDHRQSAVGNEHEPFLIQRVDDVSESAVPSSNSRDSSPAAVKGDAAPHVPSTPLRRSGYIVFLVLLYAGLAISSWVLLCLLTFEPLTAHHYGVDIDTRHNNGYGWASPLYIHSLYVKSEHIFRAARIIQAIVSVLTIPLTSAVCSKAAVVFVQQRGQQFGFSMRQLMTLADKGWTDPDVICRLLFAGWKKYGSSFLLLAILLNLLGAAIAPVQQLFLSQKTILTPVFPNLLSGLTDIPDFFDTDGITNDDNLITVLTRNALTTATNADYQPRLWTDAWTCNQMNHTDSALPLWCVSGGGITFGDVSSLPNPWLAQLPSSYNTGLVKQFLPRFNSSVAREVVKEQDMPKDCANLPGAFYVRYAKLGEIDWLGSGNWSIEVCMPENQSSTPWASTRRRQDFTEELYLNISLLGYMLGDPDYPKSVGGMFKFTSRTTGGYFELPNYMNDGKAGPLITGDPSDNCGIDCYAQGSTYDSIYNHNITARSANITARSVDITARAVNITGSVINETYTAKSLDAVMNKGPLLTVAMALFGDNSFIPNRLNHPEAYIYDNIPYHAPWNGVCVNQAPFMGLLNSYSNFGDPYNSLSYCITNWAPSWRDLDSQIANYIHAFYSNSDGDERIVNAFTSAVYIATEQWLLNPHTADPSLTVSYDLGAETEIPVISHRGMIIVSVLLALDIGCLLVMAIYSAITPRWTDQLNSFAMMRIGAAMSEQLPFNIAYTTRGIDILDETPGFIGQTAFGEPGSNERGGHVGELGLGAAMPLKSGTRYRCYPDDHDPSRSPIPRTAPQRQSSEKATSKRTND